MPLGNSLIEELKKAANLDKVKQFISEHTPSSEEVQQDIKGGFNKALALKQQLMDWLGQDNVPTMGEKATYNVPNPWEKK